jgi:uncharacterized Fe-S cluster-containing radical SAM superfamily enzyme
MRRCVYCNLDQGESDSNRKAEYDKLLCKYNQLKDEVVRVQMRLAEGVSRPSGC